MKDPIWVIPVLLLICFCVLVVIDINQRPPRSEVKAMIEGDTLSIFHINNAGVLQSCLYLLILIELNEIEGLELRQRLEYYVKWMAAMEKQREAMERDKFEGD